VLRFPGIYQEQSLNIGACRGIVVGSQSSEASKLLVSQTSSPAPAGWPLLFALLAVDGLALLGQLAGSLASWLGFVPATPYLFRLEEAYSFASLAMFAKWLAISILLAMAWHATRQPLLFGLSVVFLVLLLDDGLELHERFGTALAARLDLPGLAGLRSDDLGELAVWGVIGGSSLAVLAEGYRRSSPAARRTGQLFIVGFAGLAAFGIGFDLLSVMASGIDGAFAGRSLRLALRLVEEGGELLIASLLVGLAVSTQRAAASTANGDDQPHAASSGMVWLTRQRRPPHPNRPFDKS
jgi:hypothetical protein